MNEIVKINPAEFGMEETKAAQIEAQFKPMLEKMTELESEFNRIISLPIDDPNTAIEAKKLRIKYVKVRTGTAEIHKTQKAFYLAAGRFIDGWKNAQLFASQSIEERLEKIENHAAIIEKQRIEALEAQRKQTLMEYTDIFPAGLGMMNEDVFQNYLTGVKVARQAQIEAEKKAEQERIERERREAEEREAQRIENERLKKEAEQREAQITKERIEAEKKINEQRIAAEKERMLIEERARKEAEELNKKRIAAEQEAEKLRKEKEAEAAELARIEKERIAAEKKAQKAPDNEKLIAFARKVEVLKAEIPVVKSEESAVVCTNVLAAIDRIIAYINNNTK